MRSLSSLALTVIAALSLSTLIACKDTTSSDKPAANAAGSSTTATATAAEGKCEHGVEKPICARCNAGLKPAFVAKNDWCGEHERPESQCAICHPDVAKAGVKP